MKKKIIYVVNDINFFISHRLHLAISAKKIFNEVYVCSSFNLSKIRYLERKGIKFLKLDLDRTNTTLFKEFRVLLSLYSIVKRIKPDVLQLITIKPLVYGSIVSLITKPKLTVYNFSGLGHIHHSKDKYLLKRIIVFILRNTIKKTKNVIFLQNKSDFQYLKIKKIVTNQKVIFTKGSGVNLNKFKPSKKINNEKIVLLASRMSKDKGVMEFISISQKIFRIDKKIKFILAGGHDPDGPSPISLELLKSLNNNIKYPNIKWIGNVKNILKLIQKSKIVMLPSYHEGVPKILLEAAACGKPIIASNISGCKEVVENNKNGYLINRLKINEMSKALLKILNNKDLANRMNKFSRKKALKEFSVQKVIDLHINQYKKIFE